MKTNTILLIFLLAATSVSCKKNNVRSVTILNAADEKIKKTGDYPELMTTNPVVFFETKYETAKLVCNMHVQIGKFIELKSIQDQIIFDLIKNDNYLLPFYLKTELLGKITKYKIHIKNFNVEKSARYNLHDSSILKGPNKLVSSQFTPTFEVEWTMAGDKSDEELKQLDNQEYNFSMKLRETLTDEASVNLQGITSSKQGEADLRFDFINCNIVGKLKPQYDSLFKIVE